MNQRLRPEQRLRNQQRIQEVFKRGRCLRGALLNIWVLEGKGSGRAQIAIAVSRKTALRANVRNLWKRRIRESFRLNQEKFMAGKIIIVQSKKKDKVPSYTEIQDEILKLALKAEILNNVE